MNYTLCQPLLKQILNFIHLNIIISGKLEYIKNILNIIITYSNRRTNNNLYKKIII